MTLCLLKRRKHVVQPADNRVLIDWLEASGEAKRGASEAMRLGIQDKAAATSMEQLVAPQLGASSGASGRLQAQATDSWSKRGARWRLSKGGRAGNR